jgi:multicomponent Na+:H+ antiporter subunit E
MRPRVAAVQFLALFGFWLLLSDQYRPLFLLMGAASAAAVTAMTGPVVATALGEQPWRLRRTGLRLWRFATYVVWLLGRIIVAGSQVAWVVLNPRVPVEPCELRFRASLDNRVARVILANTISLVPGTLTLQLEGDEYLVHAIRPEAVNELLDGSMQRMVGRIFFEDPGPAAEAVWLPTEEVGE